MTQTSKDVSFSLQNSKNGKLIQSEIFGIKIQIFTNELKIRLKMMVFKLKMSHITKNRINSSTTLSTFTQLICYKQCPGCRGETRHEALIMR